MSQKYDLQHELESLNTVLAEYHGWFFDVLQRVFYFDARKSDKEPLIPSLFVESLNDLNAEGLEDFSASSLRKVSALHHDLQDMASHMLQAVRAGQKPVSAAEFEKFSALFKTFMSSLQKTCQNHILEEWGLDVLTGLKNKHAILIEIAQEMERLARQGRSFSIALARIDNLPQIDLLLGWEEGNRFIKMVAKFIDSSLRIYDAAYRLDRQHFILVLKQSDLTGGQRALERLRDQMDAAGQVYTLNGVEMPLTMSCCVAMPLADDDIAHLIEDLQKDLGMHVREQGAVLTYYEMSPLQRFIKTQKET